MVPDGVSWQSLRVFFAKDFLVTFVFLRKAFFLFVFSVYYSWDDDCSADVVSVLVGFSWHVSGSWYEDSFLCVGRSKDDGELGVVYPSFLSVDLWLGAGEPGVPEDCLLFSQVREEEPHGGCRSSCTRWEVRVV